MRPTSSHTALSAFRNIWNSSTGSWAAAARKDLRLSDCLHTPSVGNEEEPNAPVENSAANCVSKTEHAQHQYSHQQRPFWASQPVGTCQTPGLFHLHPRAAGLTLRPHASSVSQQQSRSFFYFGPSPFGSFNYRDYLTPERKFTNSMLAINTALWLLCNINRGFAWSLALIPTRVAQGEWLRLVTSGFVHTSFLHLLGNMLAVHWLCPTIEQHCGTLRTSIIYLTSVLMGSYFQYKFGFIGSVSLGASGGIAGLFAAYIMYKWRNKAYIGFGQQDMMWIAQIIGINVVLSMLSGGHIAHWVHFGGAVGGAGMMYLIGPRYRWTQGYTKDVPLIDIQKWLK